ncbi:MAG: D-2-hydroxyacid dehydrogenase [Verrucomicrobia bacterium]|nr:D-2-hydroxyacid dehydrogenase [Verrucomicrobiota bacterium]
MKIVVLDGYTLNPGDLDWAELQTLGSCTVFDRSEPHEVIGRARDAGIVLTNKTPLPRAVLSSLPELRYVGVLATGVNVVDLAAARDHRIVLTNVPAYSTASVAQLTFALILELAHQVGAHTASVHEGGWSRCPDFSYWMSEQVELEGRVLGIVGFGAIGKAVARLGSAFGMKVLACTRTGTLPTDGLAEGVSLRELFERSDIISLHCPLTEITRSLVNRETLGWMKPGAWFINTSRGPLVDETALAEALRSGRLGAAALDVLGVEPPPADHPLFGVPRCLITPHIGWASRAARSRLMRTAVANVRAFLAGQVQNQV